MQSGIANVVRKQLNDDFPPADTQWVLAKDVSWSKLTSVPLASIDFSNEKNWNAYEHKNKLKKFMQKIRRGDRKPVILARIPDNDKLVVLDGHHRSLAHENMRMPVNAYIATITGPSETAALAMHTGQRKGNSGIKAGEQKFSNAYEFTPMTAVSSTKPSPFTTNPKPGLWHNTGMELAPYIQNVAKALLRKGSAKTESEAIHMAYGLIKKWAQGRANNGQRVHPDVQAAAARNLADMDAKRMKTHMKHGTNLSNSGAVELAGTVTPKQQRNSLTALDFHKIPAAMRKVKAYYKKQGVPDEQAVAQTIAFFKHLKASGNPIFREAAPAILASYAKRKKWAKAGQTGRYSKNLVHGKKNDEAGGDTGYSYKQMHFANEHHDGNGKFAGNTKERERILKTFQEQHKLPVTGFMDAQTKAVLAQMNHAISDTQ